MLHSRATIRQILSSMSEENFIALFISSGNEKSASLERKYLLEKVKASFGVIPRLYIILIILLIVKPAYTGSVSEQKMQDSKVTSGECLEVLEKGNFMPVNDTNFYRIFYDGHLYIMTIKYMGIIKHYSCDMKIKLIKN